VIHHPSSNNTSYSELESSVQQLSIGLPLHILDIPPPSTTSNVPFVQNKTNSAANSTSFSLQNAQLSNKKVSADSIKDNIYPLNTAKTHNDTQGTVFINLDINFVA
jgi:hypothetical protein